MAETADAPVMPPAYVPILQQPSFWARDPKEQRRMLEAADPRFRGLSQESYERVLAANAKKYRPPSPLTPPTSPRPGSLFGQDPMNLQLPEAVQRHLPTILGGVVSLKSPLLGAATAGITKGLQTGSPLAGAGEAAGFFGGTLLGKGLGALGTTLTRTKAYKALQNTISTNLVKLMQQKVPAWKTLTSLTEMFQSQDALSAAREISLKESERLAIGRDLAIDLDDADALGIAMKAPIGKLTGPVKWIVVDAEEAVKKTVGQSKKFPGPFRRVNEALDRAGIGDAKDREAYRWGIGMINYFKATNSLKGGTLDLQTAMQGLLSKPWDILRTRGMQEFGIVLRGQAPEQVKRVIGGSAGPLAGEAIGAAAGAPAGHLFTGGFLGRTVGRLAPPKYAGVPELPSVQALRRFGPLVGGVVGSEAVEQIEKQME